MTTRIFALSFAVYTYIYVNVWIARNLFGRNEKQISIVLCLYNEYMICCSEVFRNEHALEHRFIQNTKKHKIVKMREPNATQILDFIFLKDMC